PIFESSSNTDAAAVIQLATPNYINDFYASAGMTKSAYTSWMGANEATNSPRLMGTDNYFTAKDVIAFFKKVHGGTLLDSAPMAKLKEWLTWSPDTGFGGWIGTKLPASAQASLMHKAGWLPPPYDARCVNEIGIVDAGGSHWYLVAIFARAAADY